MRVALRRQCTKELLLDHYLSPYIGTGHADATRWEWATSQQRDTLALVAGQTAGGLGAQLAIADNESLARVHFTLTRRMVLPCGPPPPPVGPQQT